jgi:hypothetical protein
MESIDTIVTKPKRQYTRKLKGGTVVPPTKPIEIIKPVEVVEVKPIEVVETKPVEVVETKTKKKKRNINPDTMTYLKAFAIWRQKNNYHGLSPKKDTDEYK